MLFFKDPVYCLEQVRSARFCQSEDEGREQVNTATSFLDLSQAYGSSVAVVEALREAKDGMLKMSANTLPERNGTRPAGDPRVHETPGKIT